VSDRRDRADLLVPALQVISDLLTAEGGFLLAYWLRFRSPLAGILGLDLGIPALRAYVLTSWVVILVWLSVFRVAGLYGSRRKTTYAGEVLRVARAVTIGMLMVTSLAFFYRGFSFSRAVCLLAWIGSAVLVGLGRIAVLALEWGLRRKGRGLVRAAVVGSSPWGREVSFRIRADTRLGITLVGTIGDTGADTLGLPFLGDLGDCAEVVIRERIDTLLVALSDAEYGELGPLMERCAGLNLELFLVPSALQLASRRVAVEDIGGVPVLKLRNVRLRGWGLPLKRGLDIALSALSLALGWPVLLAIGVAVRLDSRGSALYRQIRVGLDAREFTIAKFRTLTADAELDTGPVWATTPDPRATRVGRLLRRFALDELPQLLNVLRGEMSLVGPRPERPEFVERLAREVPAYAERHRVKCGITGWAQVSGYRGDTSVAHRVRYDIWYIENWSMALDFRILLMTPWVVLSGRPRR
jgi:exopolysaccharide biosynthesis polyprenyl glycosylphosphotransferase